MVPTSWPILPMSPHGLAVSRLPWRAALLDSWSDLDDEIVKLSYLVQPAVCANSWFIMFSSLFNQWLFHEILTISRTETGKWFASFSKMTWAIGIKKKIKLTSPYKSDWTEHFEETAISHTKLWRNSIFICMPSHTLAVGVLWFDTIYRFVHINSLPSKRKYLIRWRWTKTISASPGHGQTGPRPLVNSRSSTYRMRFKWSDSLSLSNDGDWHMHTRSHHMYGILSGKEQSPASLTAEIAQ
jgi:hypothetical protein